MSTKISAGVDDCPCFSTFITRCMIPITCEIFLVTIIILVNSQVPLQKKVYHEYYF